MDEPIRISSSKPAFQSQDYSFLKEEGMKIIREAASATWTDHNIHDPGITMLEAFCYSLTEIGLRTGMEMADLLTSSQQFAEQEFFTVAEILPVAPVSSLDFQKVLIDHPLVRNGWVNKIAADPNGQLSVLLEFADDKLNSNIFTLVVTPPSLGADYLVDLAFPYWDETDVKPFQEDVEILNASFSIPWQPLKNDNAQFASILLDYQPSTGPAATLELWLVLQVTSLLDNALVELPAILQETENLLFTLPNENLLKEYNHRVINANVSMRSVERYIRDYRNLCEDFTDFKAVRLQEIAFSATLEISSGVDIESLLANMFFFIDQHLSPPVMLKSLTDLQGEGNDTATIFEGPMLYSGFVKTDELLSTQPPTKVYNSDILRLIFQQRNPEGTDVRSREKLSNRRIIALRNLTLSNWLDNHAITKGAKDCLQLIDSSRHLPRLSPSKCQIVFIRNDVKVSYDFGRAIEMFRKLKEEFLDSLAPGSEDIPIPNGDTLSLGDYYPVQNDLPVVYGVGKYGLPATASPSRRAQAKQLKGYLLFYEQLLAGQLSQLTHINSLFSADPELGTTVFHQPLYNLPEVSDLFGFQQDSPEWQEFQADENNSYQQVITSAEKRGLFLDRRNRFLDHLLARLGEDMQSYAEMVIQEVVQMDGSEGMDLDTILALQKEHYLDALEQLIRDKSAFYYELPTLNRDRFQAFGNLLWRLDSAIVLQETPLGFHWQILDYNENPVIESLDVSATRSEAERTAAMSLVLATSENNYEISPAAGLHVLLLGQAPGGNPIARSVNTFGSSALAEAERDLIIQSMRRKWLEFSLIPLERRLYHFFGIETRQRRLLVTSINEYFEIFDEIDADPLIEKRFRLWRLPGATGAILLESIGNFQGPDDQTATENALVAIETVITSGKYKKNYVVEENGPNQFQIALGTPDGNLIARSTSVFPDSITALAEIDLVQGHLYRFFSREGFYLVENFLLFPPDSSSPALLIPDTLGEPYSFQVTFIFPSGYHRDFNDPASVPEPSKPDRFRGEEFRRYVNRMVRNTCPSHILPRIRWVDTAQPETLIPDDVPCFDLFEQRYRAWLQAYLTDSIDDSEVESFRAPLVECLNAIFQESSF